MVSHNSEPCWCWCWWRSCVCLHVTLRPLLSRHPCSLRADTFVRCEVLNDTSHILPNKASDRFCCHCQPYPHWPPGCLGDKVPTVSGRIFSVWSVYTEDSPTIWWTHGPLVHGQVSTEDPPLIVYHTLFTKMKSHWLNVHLYSDRPSYRSAMEKRYNALRGRLVTPTHENVCDCIV